MSLSVALLGISGGGHRLLTERIGIGACDAEQIALDIDGKAAAESLSDESTRTCSKLKFFAGRNDDGSDVRETGKMVRLYVRTSRYLLGSCRSRFLPNRGIECVPCERRAFHT